MSSGQVTKEIVAEFVIAVISFYSERPPNPAAMPHSVLNQDDYHRSHLQSQHDSRSFLLLIVDASRMLAINILHHLVGSSDHLRIGDFNNSRHSTFPPEKSESHYIRGSIRGNAA
jgi:hypothetical protein